MAGYSDYDPLIAGMWLFGSEWEWCEVHVVGVGDACVAAEYEGSGGNSCVNLGGESGGSGEVEAVFDD